MNCADTVRERDRCLVRSETIRAQETGRPRRIRRSQRRCPSRVQRHPWRRTCARNHAPCRRRPRGTATPPSEGARHSAVIAGRRSWSPHRPGVVSLPTRRHPVADTWFRGDVPRTSCEIGAADRPQFARRRPRSLRFAGLQQYWVLMAPRSIKHRIPAASIGRTGGS